MLALDRENISLIQHVRRLLHQHELIVNLTARDLRVRYKQSLLGVAWAVIQPFALMVVFTVVFSYFVKVKTAGIPYPIFSYVALVPWTFFANALTFGVISLVTNATLVAKIYFPRETLPLASLLASLVDFLVASCIFVGMLVYYHMGITAEVLWFPLLVLVQMAFTFGVLLVLSAGNVFYRDIRLLLPFLLQVWLYVTPVIYPLTLVPQRFRFLISLNPMTGLVDAYRRVMLLNQPPDFHLMAYTTASSLGLLLVGFALFKRLELQFADVI